MLGGVRMKSPSPGIGDPALGVVRSSGRVAAGAPR